MPSLLCSSLSCWSTDLGVANFAFNSAFKKNIFFSREENEWLGLTGWEHAGCVCAAGHTRPATRISHAFLSLWESCATLISDNYGAFPFYLARCNISLKFGNLP